MRPGPRPPRPKPRPASGPRSPLCRDGGTTIPLLLLAFLVAGTFATASVAASAAFLAQRDLAGLCDGAAVAAANAVDRAALDSGGDSLRLDPAAVADTVAAYRQQAGPDAVFRARTDGWTVTVTCTRTVHIPFGAVLGRSDGLDRTAVASARSPLLLGN